MTYLLRRLDFIWRRAHTLHELYNGDYLPNHSSGVYRLFAPNKSIDRCCGKDTSGTLYLGCAGTKRNWSNLRTRIRSIVNGEHHAITNVHCNETVRKAFPRDRLAVHWAYMGNEQPTTAKMNPAALLRGPGFWPAITTPLVSTRRGIKKDKKPRPDNRQYSFCCGQNCGKIRPRLLRP